MLGTLAGSVLRGETALPALLERVRESFGLTSVTLLERAPRRDGPAVPAACAGDADGAPRRRGPAERPRSPTPR